VQDNLDNLETVQASIGLTNSSDGDRAQQPLSTLYAEITGSESAQSLCTFVDYLGDGTDEKPLGCDGVEAPTP
jgi:predicted transcriptional regulator